MTGGFTVAAEELAQKAEAISEVSSSITECGTAAEEMGVGGLVYGVLFDPTVLPLLDQVKEFMSEAITSLAQAADSISSNLKKNSETYASVETFLTSHFGTMSTDTPQPSPSPGPSPTPAPR